MMNDLRNGILYRCWISTDGGTTYTVLINQFFLRVAGEYKCIRIMYSYIFIFYGVMMSPCTVFMH